MLSESALHVQRVQSKGGGQMLNEALSLLDVKIVVLWQAASFNRYPHGDGKGTTLAHKSDLRTVYLFEERAPLEVKNFSNLEASLAVEIS